MLIEINENLVLNTSQIKRMYTRGHEVKEFLMDFEPYCTIFLTKEKFDEIKRQIGSKP
jgi:hypothetical protein